MEQVPTGRVVPPDRLRRDTVPRLRAQAHAAPLPAGTHRRGTALLLAGV